MLKLINKTGNRTYECNNCSTVQTIELVSVCLDVTVTQNPDVNSLRRMKLLNISVNQSSSHLDQAFVVYHFPASLLYLRIILVTGSSVCSFPGSLYLFIFFCLFILFYVVEILRSFMTWN